MDPPSISDTFKKNTVSTQLGNEIQSQNQSDCSQSQESFFSNFEQILSDKETIAQRCCLRKLIRCRQRKVGHRRVLKTAALAAKLRKLPLKIQLQGKNAGNYAKYHLTIYKNYVRSKPQLEEIYKNTLPQEMWDKIIRANKEPLQQISECDQTSIILKHALSNYAVANKRTLTDQSEVLHHIGVLTLLFRNQNNQVKQALKL